MATLEQIYAALEDLLVRATAIERDLAKVLAYVLPDYPSPSPLPFGSDGPISPEPIQFASQSDLSSPSFPASPEYYFRGESG